MLVLAFIFFYKLGDSLATALATKFYLDMGFTMTQIGVIATPGVAAQDVCDRLVAAGVCHILSFAPRFLSVPAGTDAW